MPTTILLRSGIKSPITIYLCVLVYKGRRIETERIRCKLFPAAKTHEAASARIFSRTFVFGLERGKLR